jgi:hypothetical protein
MLVSEVIGLSEVYPWVRNLLDTRYRHLKDAFPVRARRPLCESATLNGCFDFAALSGLERHVPRHPHQHAHCHCRACEQLPLPSWLRLSCAFLDFALQAEFDVQVATQGFAKLKPEIRDILFADYVEEVACSVVGMERGSSTTRCSNFHLSFTVVRCCCLTVYSFFRYCFYPG